MGKGPLWICVILVLTLPVVLGEGVSPEVVIGLGVLEEARLGPDGDMFATCSDSMLNVWFVNGTPHGMFACPDGVFSLGCEWSPDKVQDRNFRQCRSHHHRQGLGYGDGDKDR